MNYSNSKRIRKIRIIATNIFMSISVVVIVFVLMLIAMGFSFNESGKLEQSGLIQLVSNPSGATVEIDGEAQFSRTELSKMLNGNVHHIKITKQDYDEWIKDIKIDAGLLTRIEWIRLFPTNPEISKAADFNDLRLAAFSPDRKKLVVIEKNNNSMLNINIQDEKIKTNAIDLSECLSTTPNRATTGIISIIAWTNNNRLILKWTHDDKTTWHYVDLDHSEKSFNLTSEFNFNFESILPSNDSGSKLWILESGNLRIIDTNNHTSSSVFATNIEKIANNYDTVAFVNTDNNTRQLAIYKEGEKGYTVLKKLDEATDETTIKLAMGAYWNESWLAYSLDQQLYILGGKYPSYNRDKPSSLKTKLERKLDYIPQLLSVNANRRVIVFAGKEHLMSYDMETNDYYDTELPAELTNINWLDNYLIWQKYENSIYVRDFDGNNRRKIIEDADNPFPVVISENNRWLYYFDITEEETANDATEDTPSDSVQVAPTTTAINYSLKRIKLQ